MTDWEKIRTGFVKDGLSYRALSREFAVPYSTIQRRGIKEDWPGQREEYLEENVGEKMKQVKTKLLRRIERTLDEDRELDSNHVHHTALYIGGGQLVQASINEYGTVTGGQTGDQTGREIYTRGYYNYPWDCVLRYTGAEEPETERAAEHVSVELPVLQRGSTGETVRAMQILLRGRGFGVGWYGADGEFGAATEEGLRAFQRVKTEETDGVCGERTWSRLLKG